MSELVVPREASGRARTFRLRLGRFRPPYAVLALAGLYVAAAQLGFVLEVTGPVAGIVWLPVGVGIAFLHLGGLRLWPGVVIGDLLVNDYGAMPLGTALGQTAGNVLEVLAAAVLLRRLVPRGSPLDSVRGVAAMLVAIAAATVISATIGSLAQVLGGVIEAAAAPRVWRTWWLGDASGALVILPLALAWYRLPGPEWLRGRAVEAACALLAVIVVSEVAMRGERPLTYVVFPVLIWAALRFGQRGATLALAIAVGIAMWSTAHYTGPFAFDDITHSVLNTQLFIAIAAVSTLCLAAVVSERESFAESLNTSRGRLVEASDNERRRLVRDIHDGAQQRLTALAVRLHIAAEQPSDPARDAAVLRNAEAELSLAVGELRELAQGLRPTTLSRHGLAPALRVLAGRSPVPVTLGALPDRRLDDTAESTAYYVVAEGLTNAYKHAGATRIEVKTLLVRGMLRVDVVDDGTGGARAAAGSGLEGLRDRVEAIGGRLTVESRPGQGTHLRARIPARHAP
jgi:signal transduction histidine kinase